MTRFLRFAATALVALLASLSPAVGSDYAGDVSRWDFEVYLNDRKVGRHLFEVTEVDGMRRVRSEADFEYRILFIPAYRYRHTNSERWADNCLLEFDAKTNANGERIVASGERAGGAFRVVGSEGAAELPACVMTFAYWNPEFLEQPRLLNPQSGEYLDVTVEQLETELLEVRGSRVPATPYRLTADKLELKIWYSPDEKWLGLESVAKGGNIIRYELS